VRPRPRASRFSFRAAACTALAALAAFGVTACGSGSSEETQSLTFTISEGGKTPKLSGPSSAETGLAEITLKNDVKSGGELQLVRVEGKHSAKEAVEGLKAATEGKPFADWLFAAGGVGSTDAGKNKTVTQVLQPGTYYAFDTEAQGTPDPASVPEMKVSGETSDATVEADETVDAFDYGFKSQQLSSGKTEIAFDNTGAQPHHLLAAPLTGDGTAQDVEKALKSGKGKPPFDEKDLQATAVLEGGEDQLVTLDLEPGRYVFFCFVTDRKGGPPHAFKGMVDEIEVEKP
jgi:hypothetical protein